MKKITHPLSPLKRGKDSNRMNGLHYITSIGAAFLSLGKGMARTFSSMVHPKRILTLQYPENRETSLYIPANFHGDLELIRDDNGGYRCTACTLCQNACPNGTIRITTRTIVTPEGKNKRVLDQYIYDLGRCTFCEQCVDACNFEALRMTNRFENSEYDKQKLVRQLNLSDGIKKEEHV